MAIVRKISARADSPTGNYINPDLEGFDFQEDATGRNLTIEIINPARLTSGTFNISYVFDGGTTPLTVEYGKC